MISVGQHYENEVVGHFGEAPWCMRLLRSGDVQVVRG